MKTLWMVTSGSYSDYHVDAAFDSEEYAQAAVAAGLGEDVTELHLYEDTDALVPAVDWTVSCVLGEDGSVGHYYERSETLWPHEERCGERPKTSVGASWKGTRHVSVVARDLEAARKVFSDRVAQLTAEAELEAAP